jgi:glycosyltransferase involved in cell wall biosynthesis
LQRLVCAADRRRLEQVVVALAPGGDLGESLAREGIQVECLGTNRRVISIGSITRFDGILKRVRPAVIQAWTYNANLFACLARAVAPSAAIIWNIRTVPYRAQLGARQRIAVELGRLASAVPTAIVYNSLAGRSVHSARGFSTKKAVVIHNGIPLPSPSRCRQQGQEWRRRRGFAEGDVVVSYVKRLVDPRWHEFFLQAARRVAESNEHARFVCVGRGISRLDALARRIFGSTDLVRRCDLMEHVTDVSPVYGGSDIVVSASGREGFPNSIGEAMACGVPCVVTDVGDSAFLVGETGRSVSFGNVVELAEAIRNMVEIGDERRRQLGARAHARIAENFSLDRMVQQYTALYEWAGGSRTPAQPGAAACAG